MELIFEYGLSLALKSNADVLILVYFFRKPVTHAGKHVSMLLGCI